MDTFNWMVMEWIGREAQQAQPTGNRKVEPTKPRRRTSATRALASLLVRLGLRLDPAAGKGLGAFSFLLAKSANASSDTPS